jgi:hypothetical protein
VGDRKNDALTADQQIFWNDEILQLISAVRPSHMPRYLHYRYHVVFHITSRQNLAALQGPLNGQHVIAGRGVTTKTSRYVFARTASNKCDK